jgi:polyhydroxyalkanoate synthesis regulator phasin
MNELIECINSGKGWAAERANTAYQIAQALETGQISSTEARELLEDLVRTDRLDAEADDMALKAMLVTGIYAVIQICG